MHVFVYGTLMLPQVWQAVVGKPFETQPATLAGFAAYRVRDAMYPGIVAAGPEEVVRGVVQFDVDAESVERLDRFEDDFYKRLPVLVRCDDGRTLEAHAYVVLSRNRHVLSNEPWSLEQFVERGGVEDFLARYSGFRRI